MFDRRRAASLMLVLGAAAAVFAASRCGDPSADRAGSDRASPGVDVRDSADVTLVEHGPIDLAGVPEWRLAPEPELEIGRVSGDPDYLLHDVFGALRRDDGSVVAIWDNRVRAFGPDGRVLWAQGTEGDGPGAYRGAYQLAEVRGDSLVVWDARLFRFSVLSADGEFARAVSVESRGAGQMPGAAGPGALLLSRARSEPNPDGIPDRLYAQRLSIAGQAVDLDGAELARWGPWVTSTRYFLSWALDEAPWEASVDILPSSRDGRPGLWLADAGAPVPELRLLRMGDAVERIVRWEVERTVTEADRDAYRRDYRDWIAGLDDRERRRSHEALLDQLPWPERFPAYDRVMTDDVGRLWVAEYLRDERVEEDDLQRWTIFSADGRRVLGWFAADRRWPVRTVKWIGAERVLVVERDDLDVERLRVYRIEKGRKER